MGVTHVDAGNRETYIFSDSSKDRKECYLRKDEYMASDGKLYPVFIVHGFIVPRRDANLIWNRWINYRMEELDGHFLGYREDKIVASGGESVGFKNIVIRHDFQSVEDYILKEAREMARGLANTMDVELQDYTLEETVGE